MSEFSSLRDLEDALGNRKKHVYAVLARLTDVVFLHYMKNRDFRHLENCTQQ